MHLEVDPPDAFRALFASRRVVSSSRSRGIPGLAGAIFKRNVHFILLVPG